MDKIWGKMKDPTKLTANLEEDTKATIRQKVWECMEKNDLANFPRPVYKRIPNFKGANLAGQKVAALDEFKAAKTVKVNPDKAQEEVRYQVLDLDKTLIVPTPRLSKGLFNRLSKEPGDSDKDTIRKLASREGIDKKSKPVPMASRIKVDLVVVGSVAVDRLGHRIGKGEGFADLEYAMAVSHHGAVNPNETLVVTTVHDIQVFDKLPEQVFEAHDLPVDVIVTPTEIIRVEHKLAKPDHIIWNMMSKEKFDQIPILKELHFKEQKAGKNTTLKDGSNPDAAVEANGKAETNGHEKKANGKAKKNYKKKPTAAAAKKPGKTEENGEKEAAPNTPEKSKETGVKTEKKVKQYPATVSVFVGKIPRGTRVKELKEVIVAKGVKPLNILWKGGKGYALVYAEKKEIATPDELYAKLKDLKIGDNALNVEPDKHVKPKAANNDAEKENNKEVTNTKQETAKIDS